MRKKKPTRGKKNGRKTKVARKKTTIRRKKRARRKKPEREYARSISVVAAEGRGLGSEAAGQSGDTQGLSRVADVDMESAEELAEEGQAYEAEVVSGVEDAPDPDEAEVTTKEVPENDVPPEYGGRD